MRKIGGSDDVLKAVKTALIGRGGSGGLGGVLPLFGGGLAQNPLKSGPISGMANAASKAVKMPSLPRAGKSSVTTGSSATPSAPKPNTQTM